MSVTLKLSLLLINGVHHNHRALTLVPLKYFLWHVLRRGRVVATPPWIFYTERLIPLYLLPVDRYGPPLFIDTKMSTTEHHMTSLCRHKIWNLWNLDALKIYVKMSKNHFLLKNSKKYGIFAPFLAEYVRKWWFSSTKEVWSIYLVKYLRNEQSKSHRILPHPPPLLFYLMTPYPNDTLKFYLIYIKNA